MITLYTEYDWEQERALDEQMARAMAGTLEGQRLAAQAAYLALWKAFDDTVIGKAMSSLVDWLNYILWGD